MGLYSKIYQVQGLILGTYLMCAGAVAGEKHDYLAMVGPAPMRFQAATVQYDPGTVLPPLKMSDAPATNVVETVTKPERAVAPTPETAPVLPEHTTPPEVAARPPVESTVPTPTPSAAPSEARPDSQMTPQMLLRYFSKDGSREVLVPTGVEFTPPPPSSGRSSATYSSPPAR